MSQVFLGPFYGLSSKMSKQCNRPSDSKRTFFVTGCTIQRDTVTVAVLFINPTLVTKPRKAMGGILADISKENEWKETWKARETRRVLKFLTTQRARLFKHEQLTRRSSPRLA